MPALVAGAQGRASRPAGRGGGPKPPLLRREPNGEGGAGARSAFCKGHSVSAQPGPPPGPRRPPKPISKLRA